MSSATLYKAFIDAGASEEKATLAAEDVVQVSQLPELATKSDITELELATKSAIAELEVRIANMELSTKTAIAELEVRIANMELSTKSEIAGLRTDMAKQETQLIKWIVGSGLVYTAIVIAGVSLLM